MNRYRVIGSICLAMTLVLWVGLVAQGVDITGTYSLSTSLSDGDTWTSGNVTINGVTVTVPTGATVTFDSTAGRNLYGTSPGTFLVNTGGTFKVATTTGDDNLVIAAPVKFDNQGTFEFASGGDLQLNNSGAVFENTGLIYKSVSGGGNDPSYIFRATANTGDFYNNGGTIQVDAGTLEILGGRSNGGTFITNGGRLQLSDHWTEFRGTATGGAVRINSYTGTSGYKFVAAAATTVVDVQDQGLRWDGRDIDTNGNILQNDGVFAIGLASTGSLLGGGTFRNSSSGTLDIQQGTVTLSGGTAFENEGTMTFTTDLVKGFDGTGTVLNKSGATAEWQDGTINLASSGVAIRNEGTFNLTGGATKVLSGSGMFENAAGATMNWQGGQLTLNSDLTNNGTFVYQNGDRNINGAGDFVNNGTFIHTASGADNITGTGSGRFVNNGVFDFAQQGDFQLKDNYTFVNNGTVRKTAGTSSDSLFFDWGTGTETGGTFDNQGTVEVLVGGIAIYKASTGTGVDDIIVPQYDAGTKTLTGGTWIIRWTSGGSSRLDLQPADDGIQTIGADAVVELSGANSLFPQLTGHLTEVAGTLTINDRTFAASDFGSGGITLTGGTIDGSGNVVLGNDVTSTGTSTVSVATLDLNGVTRTVSVTNTLDVSSQVIDGGLTKTGSGTLVLSGSTNNTYTGLTTVSGGMLQLKKTSSAVAVAGDIQVDGGKLQWSGNNQVADTATITLNNGTLETNTDTVANVTVNNTNGPRTTWVHRLTITDTLRITGGMPFLGSGSTTSANRVVMTTGAEIEMAANTGDTIMNIGSGGLSMSDAVWHLGISTLGSPYSALINLGGDFEGSGNNSLTYYTTNGPRLLDLQDATRTFDITDGTTAIGVTIQDGGLTKTGAGTLILGGSNTYAGSTAVEAGTLSVNGSIASDVTINGGCLKGDGTVGGVVVGSSGSISAGNSPGLLTIDGDYEQSGLMLVELAGATQGLTYDSIDVSGTATLGSGAVIDVDLIGFDPLYGDVFDVLTADQGIDADLSSLVFDYSDAATTYFLRAQIVSLGGTVEALRLTAVPEPSAFILLALAGAGLLAWPGRRRKRGA